MFHPNMNSTSTERSGGRVFRFSLLLVFVLSACVHLSNAAFAQGSLQLVFHPRNGKSTDQHPLTNNMSYLWCQAAESGINDEAEKIPISKAHFLHFNSEHPDKSYNARIVDNVRAYLDLGTKDLFVAGKYRCELTTTDNEFVYGNMFIYMRPVFHTNGSMRLDFVDDENSKFEFIGASIRAIRGSTAVISCPAVGYPPPTIYWFKDHRVIQETEKYSFVKNELHVRDVEDKDEGSYRCIATNEYPAAVDHQNTKYKAVLDQQLRVSSSLGWLVPLIIIIVILIILFVVIYTCTYLKKREAQRYNVSNQEKKLHNAEQHRLQEVEEEE